MKKTLLSLFITFNLMGLSQDRFVTLGNAPDYGFLFGGDVSFERSKAYVNGSNSEAISQNYLGFKTKIEYGIFRQFKLTSEFDMLNFKLRSGLVGIKYELPFASYKVLKNGNSMTLVVVPQVNFIFPLSQYDMESVLAIGNRSFGLAMGATFWIPIYRINADLKLYGGYNLYKNPVPNAFQFNAQFGKLIGPIYIGLEGDFQKSFGTEDYFSGSFSSYQELPVSYSKVGLEVKYAPNYQWEVGLQPTYLFRGKNVRKSLGIEMRFVWVLDFTGG